MPQHSITIDWFEIVWGIDPACGYFITVFDMLVDEDDDDFVILNKDETLEKITEDDVIATAAAFGANPLYVAKTLLLDTMR